MQSVEGEEYCLSVTKKKFLVKKIKQNKKYIQLQAKKKKKRLYVGKGMFVKTTETISNSKLNCLQQTKHIPLLSAKLHTYLVERGQE